MEGFEIEEEKVVTSNLVHDTPASTNTCANCSNRFSNICKALLAAAPPHQSGDMEGHTNWQVHSRARARKNIKSSGDRSDRVGVICQGWAFRFAQLPDGRRQILSILIPGDVITPTRVFDETVQFSVQALTEVRYCGYDRSTLSARLATSRPLSDAWATLIVAEHQQLFRSLVDLGCRSADERIAHLILNIKSRLEQRGLVAEQSFAFPLSQRVIAEATGLTPEHVSRVIASFRRAGLIDNRAGWLTILKLPELQRIGALSC